MSFSCWDFFLKKYSIICISGSLLSSFALWTFLHQTLTQSNSSVTNPVFNPAINKYFNFLPSKAVSTPICSFNNIITLFLLSYLHSIWIFYSNLNSFYKFMKNRKMEVSMVATKCLSNKRNTIKAKMELLGMPNEANL